MFVIVCDFPVPGGPKSITARGGTLLADVEALLARHGQRLPFEPPSFGSLATLGGTVAAGLAGPARVARGPVRDYVLGARLLTGDGRVLKFGGEVMKNVAGYDVSRLLAENRHFRMHEDLGTGPGFYYLWDKAAAGEDTRNEP